MMTYIHCFFYRSPLGLLAFYALFFLNPTKTGKYKERQWMMGVFLRLIIIMMVQHWIWMMIAESLELIIV